MPMAVVKYRQTTQKNFGSNFMKISLESNGYHKSTWISTLKFKLYYILI